MHPFYDCEKSRENVPVFEIYLDASVYSSLKGWTVLSGYEVGPRGGASRYKTFWVSPGPLSCWKSRKQLFDRWLKRWLPHSLPNRQSLSRITDLLSTSFTCRIIFHLLMTWFSQVQSFTLMNFILKESVYSFEYRRITSIGHKMHKENKPNLVYRNDNSIFL